jgi:hypothetical protein
MDLRIKIERPTDYSWPFVAVLQRREGGEWHEEDAWGGDTEAEAIGTLKLENRQAAKVEEVVR